MFLFLSEKKNQENGNSWFFLVLHDVNPGNKSLFFNYDLQTTDYRDLHCTIIIKSWLYVHEINLLRKQSLAWHSQPCS